MQVVEERDGGIVRRVCLLDDAGKEEVALVCRFLSYLGDPDITRIRCVLTPMICGTWRRF
ncbi:MAG TPA: hypothetical protein VF003_19020 [Pseudonocardiaceae bacterium]